MTSQIAFIGGGNMASAIIGGLLKQGRQASDILVVEPFAEARQRLGRELPPPPQKLSNRPPRRRPAR